MLEERLKDIQQEALRRYQEMKSRKQEYKQTVTDIIQMVARRSIIPPQDKMALERLVNKSDLFPIAYLQAGLSAGKAVCRISIKDKGGRVAGYGTGFMVSPSLLITNHHVLPTAEEAKYSVAEFNYEEDVDGVPCESAIFSLSPDRFFLNDEALDIAVVAVEPNSTTGRAVAEFGFLPLHGQRGKIVEHEYVSIIQHPKGGFKAVVVRENEVKFMGDRFIHYITDTEPGSSGSPVFNDQWVVVAVHHSGVPDPNNPDKWVANEGVRISSVIEYLTQQKAKLRGAKRALLQELLGEETAVRTKKTLMEADTLSNDWYKDCKGYDAAFLGDGYEVPLPSLKGARAKDIAKSKDGNKLLHYTHFSIMMCKSRRLPFYTVVNIDGKNLIDLRRTGDKWYYDPRLPEEDQCGPALYDNNDLDRGHLVRRIDPLWGVDANRANEDTFHFTNCSPQHKNLNQKIWLNLEDYLLSNARKYAFRVTVFSGPVFRDDDLLYRNEFRVPAEFWKIAVMVKEDGKLSATAYLQTQKNLIANLEFAYGEYKTYQVPITQIETLTGLNFGGLRGYDPVGAMEASVVRVVKGLKDIRF